MHRTIILLCAAALLLTGCGGATAGQASPAPEPRTDGAQNYASVEDLYTAVTESGVECADLNVDDHESMIATAQGTCRLDGGRLLMQLWDDATDRDETLSDIMIDRDDYCFVLGRGEGDEGAWSVDAGTNYDVCEELGTALGGELFDTRDDSSASSSSASSAPTTSAAPPPPPVTAEPVVFSGTGDSVVSITKPGGTTGTVLVTVTGNDAGRYFGVEAIDGDGDTLVNTTDPYTGTVLMDTASGNTTQLQVTAVGPWNITISELQSAPRLNAGANAGSGDAVLLYQGPRGVAAVTGNAEGRYFGVSLYTATGRDSLINTTDPYTGSVPLPAGPAVVAMTSSGDWTINVT